MLAYWTLRALAWGALALKIGSVGEEMRVAFSEGDDVHKHPVEARAAISATRHLLRWLLLSLLIRFLPISGLCLYFLEGKQTLINPAKHNIGKAIIPTTCNNPSAGGLIH